MPIYEYQCADCHHQFDVLQKISDDSPQHCPECAKSHVVRLVSAAAFQLKGSGWYATDFKNKGKPAEKNTSEASSEGTTPSKEPNANTPKTTEPSTVSSVTTKGDSD